MRHRFHAICPYFAMFPESFAERWIESLTSEGDAVLDPFCGRGTVPFQAALMKRRGIGNDINPVAFCVTKAKVDSPELEDLLRRISALESTYDSFDWLPQLNDLPEFFSWAFSANTLGQILFLRSQLNWMGSSTDAMIAALVLGALHGESSRSPSYLSNQMPRTISTKPQYSVNFWRTRSFKPPERDTFRLLAQKAAYRYDSPRPPTPGFAFQGDMRDLPRLLQPIFKPIRCVITSPPYFDTTSFEEDQWLRLWFLGGPPHPTRNRVSKDDRHETASGYWGFISDMWRSLSVTVDDRANVVIRLGMKGRDPRQVVEMLEGCAAAIKRRVSLISWECSEFPRKQTNSFRPNSAGLKLELDCHFLVA